MFHSSSGVLLLPEGGAVTAMCTSQCCCLGDVYISFSAFCFAVMNGVGECVCVYVGDVVGGQVKVQYLLTQVKLPGSSVNVCVCAVNDNDDCKEQSVASLNFHTPPIQQHVVFFSFPSIGCPHPVWLH